MATEGGPAETKVSDQGMVTIPASLRRRLDIEPGDKLRWTIDEDRGLSVEIVHQREGVFDDFEPVDAGSAHRGHPTSRLITYRKRISTLLRPSSAGTGNSHSSIRPSRHMCNGKVLSTSTRSTMTSMLSTVSLDWILRTTPSIEAVVSSAP